MHIYYNFVGLPTLTQNELYHLCSIFSGELHVPLEVCGAVVKREFDYWMINENHIKSCCWSNYRTYIENQRILEAFNTNLLTDKKFVDVNELEGWEKYRTQIWYILEYPGTSKTALVSRGVAFSRSDLLNLHKMTTGQPLTKIRMIKKG